MNPPKSTHFAHPCHCCGKKTIYALRTKSEVLKNESFDMYICPECIAKKVNAQFTEMVEAKARTDIHAFEKIFSPGFRFSVYTVGRTMDINIMIPSNASWDRNASGYPFVLVASDPMTYDMESLLYYADGIGTLNSVVRKALVERFLLEPEAETKG